MNLLKTNSMRKFVVSVRQYDDERYITSKSLMLYDAVDADWLFNKIREFVSNLVVENAITPIPTTQTDEVVVVEETKAEVTK